MDHTKLGDTSRRPEKVRVRLSDAEKERVQAQAAAAGVSVNEFCRRRLLGRPIYKDIELAKIGAFRALAQAILDRRVGTESDVILGELDRAMLECEATSIGDASLSDDRQAD